MPQDPRYYLMHNDVIVLEGKIHEVTGEFTAIIGIENEEHLPPDILFFDWRREREVSLSHLNRWWSKRGIPDNRDGLSPLLRYLGVMRKGHLQMLNYGLSLSDTYWIKPISDSSVWDQLNFFTKPFSMDIGKAVFGVEDRDPAQIDPFSPDLSTNGWLKKTWRTKDGIRFLMKGGSYPNYQEPINEVLASKLLETLNIIPFVQYSLAAVKGTACCACRNFLDGNTEFIPASLIYNTEPRAENISIYQHLIERCRAFGILNMEDFLDRMLQVDYILANTDRHLGNFGFLRDADTLEFLGPAPLFDNGTALWNNEVVGRILHSMNLSKPFDNLHADQIRYVNHFHITPEMLKDIPELFEEIMLMKSGLPRGRIGFVRRALSENIESFNRIVEKAPPEKQPCGQIEPIETAYNASFPPAKGDKNHTLLDSVISGARRTIRENRTKPVNHKTEEEVKRAGERVKGRD